MGRKIALLPHNGQSVASHKSVHIAPLSRWNAKEALSLLDLAALGQCQPTQPATGGLKRQRGWHPK